MIKSKKDYNYYLSSDLRRVNIKTFSFLMLFRYPTVYFIKTLRRLEYYQNCRHDPIGRLFCLAYKLHFRILSIYLGFTIPPNTCGPGLKLNHWGTIVISPEAAIGSNAHINVCVNIGLKDGLAPIVGDDVYIGPGAKLFGGIRIGNNVNIGANAVVNKSFPDNVTVAGVPARIIGTLEEPLRDDAQWRDS